MHNLDLLVIVDDSCSNSWIFDPAQIKFQLREARLRFAWDAPFVEFLESQRKLCTLSTYESLSDPRISFLPGCLPVLQIFDGTFMVGMQLLSSPITHMQLGVDHDMLEQFLRLLPQVANLHKTLRGFSLLDLPDELAFKSLNIISKACPNLRHVGLIPLPPTNVELPLFISNFLNLIHIYVSVFSATRFTIPSFTCIPFVLSSWT